MPSPSRPVAERGEYRVPETPGWYTKGLPGGRSSAKEKTFFSLSRSSTLEEMGPVQGLPGRYLATGLTGVA